MGGRRGEEGGEAGGRGPDGRINLAGGILTKPKYENVAVEKKTEWKRFRWRRNGLCFCGRREDRGGGEGWGDGGREGGSQSEQTVSLDLRKNYFFHQHFNRK